MIRTQIQLDEEQYRRLQEVAREEKVSMAELVRVGADLAIAQYERRKRWGRASALIGRFSSGRSDVAQRHDRYLAEAFDK